jgi:hypothetical protein
MPIANYCAGKPLRVQQHNRQIAVVVLQLRLSFRVRFMQWRCQQ